VLAAVIIDDFDGFPETGDLLFQSGFGVCGVASKIGIQKAIRTSP
jgi:hypothetical protein